MGDLPLQLLPTPGGCLRSGLHAAETSRHAAGGTGGSDCAPEDDVGLICCAERACSPLLLGGIRLLLLGGIGLLLCGLGCSIWDLALWGSIVWSFGVGGLGFRLGRCRCGLVF